MHLESIPLEEYIKFAQKHFKEAEKNISKEAIEQIYQYFEGITWYMQKVLHTLYDMTPVHEVADVSMVEEAICQIIGSFQYTYSETLFRMPEKQKRTAHCHYQRREKQVPSLPVHLSRNIDCHLPALYNRH